MAYREFIDEKGAEWTVYDVVPRADDRRRSDRRADDGSSDAEEDDRRGEDRRVTFRSSRPVRLTSGWLCFERDGERRRLQPIPEKWHHLSDAQLAALLGEARPAPRRKLVDQGAGISQR